MHLSFIQYGNSQFECQNHYMKPNLLLTSESLVECSKRIADINKLKKLSGLQNMTKFKNEHEYNSCYKRLLQYARKTKSFLYGVSISEKKIYPVLLVASSENARKLERVFVFNEDTHMFSDFWIKKDFNIFSTKSSAENFLKQI